MEWLPHPRDIWIGDSDEPSEPDLAIRVPGWPALYVDGRKRSSYAVWRDRRRRTNGDFSPMVFEHYGCVGEQTLGTIVKLARRSALTAGRSPSAEAERWLELLGARAQLESAGMLLEA